MDEKLYEKLDERARNGLCNCGRGDGHGCGIGVCRRGGHRDGVGGRQGYRWGSHGLSAENAKTGVFCIVEKIHHKF